MQELIIFGLIIVAIILMSRLASHGSRKRKVFKNNVYSYSAKSSVMTNAESNFFRKLDRLVGDRCYVFPQMHLSSFLDHRVKGQEWKYAFSHINGKSVDYVLCDKATLRPVLAIELDDYTHSQKDRKTRDIEVERLFRDANMKLVRLKNIDMSDEQILKQLF